MNLRRDYPEAPAAVNLLRRADCRVNILLQRYVRRRTRFSQL